MECWTQARHRFVEAMADKVVGLVLSCAHQENQTRVFLGAARPEIIEVSIAGKSFFVSKQV